jgi:CRISPR-associated protein Cmr3
MNTYKIKIKPVDTFYFGGEKKFNPADSTDSNYLVESLRTPQQTTILGMLRYALLKELIKPIKSYQNKIENLIGETSFDAKSTKYGIIEKLSPVFIEKEGDLYIEAGLDYQIYNNKETKRNFPIHLELESIGGYAQSSITKEDKVYFYSNYDPKQPLQHYLTTKGAHNTPISNLIPYNDIFKECQQPGNKKDRTGNTSLEGFYKQTKFRMEEGFNYCVFLQSKEELPDTSFFATLGGDQSLFRINLRKEAENVFPDNPVAKQEKGIVKLISHAFISSLSNIYFSFLETTDFRYLRTKYGETNADRYASIIQTDPIGDVKNKKHDKKDSLEIPKMSEHIRLVSKGSVFYCKDVAAFVKDLNNIAYQTIGYNYYEIIYQK